MDEYSGQIGVVELADELGVDVDAVKSAGDAYATERGLERTYADVNGGLPYREYTADAANAIRDKIRES